MEQPALKRKRNGSPTLDISVEVGWSSFRKRIIALPLLSAGLSVTFSSAEHQRCLDKISVTGAHAREELAQSRYATVVYSRE